MKEITAKYTLPIVFENINTKPKVFRISAEMVEEGFFPMVYYLTNIDLKDTSALKAENGKIKQETGKMFAGIDKDKKYVFYQAMNEIPDGT